MRSTDDDSFHDSILCVYQLQQLAVGQGGAGDDEEGDDEDHDDIVIDSVRKYVCMYVCMYVVSL